MFKEHQLTPEEIKKAEEEMTPTQSELSRNRGKRTKAWEDAGLNGELHVVNRHMGFPAAFEGEVNGHTIHVEQLKGYENRDNFKAVVDGQEKSSEISRELFYKYVRLGLVDLAPDEIENMKEIARQEVSEMDRAFKEDKARETEQQQEAQLLKDIGL